MTVSCWIIDDEPDAHKAILIALRQYSDFEVSFQSFEANPAVLNKLPKPDVIFLDISMPKRSGFEFLKRFRSISTLIVFITAHNNYALKAYDHDAVDYLLKPIDDTRFEQMIEKVRAHLSCGSYLKFGVNFPSKIDNTSHNHTLNTGLSVQTDDALYYVKQLDIIYIESVSDHLAIHLSNKTLITRNTFIKLSLSIDQVYFHRVHKSYMVNLIHITKFEKGRFGDGAFWVSNGDRVKLSRRYKHVLSKLKNVQQSSRIG